MLVGGDVVTESGLGVSTLLSGGRRRSAGMVVALCRTAGQQRTADAGTSTQGRALKRRTRQWCPLLFLVSPKTGWKELPLPRSRILFVAVELLLRSAPMMRIPRHPRAPRRLSATHPRLQPGAELLGAELHFGALLLGRLLEADANRRCRRECGGIEITPSSWKACNGSSPHGRPRSPREPSRYAKAVSEVIDGTLDAPGEDTVQFGCELLCVMSVPLRLRQGHVEGHEHDATLES